jgi:uncharacterized membrane protein
MSISDRPAARAIKKLNARLLALAESEEDISAVDIERTAKAISLLIRTIEQSEDFLSTQDEDGRVGDRLSPERHRQLMIRIRNAVERGLLDEPQSVAVNP